MWRPWCPDCPSSRQKGLPCSGSPSTWAYTPLCKLGLHSFLFKQLNGYIIHIAYNSSIKSVQFNGILHIHRLVQPAPRSSLEHVHHPPRETPRPLSCHFPPPASGNHSSPFCHYGFAYPDISYQWNPTTRGLQRLASFAHDNVFKARPRGSPNRYFTPFYRRITFHCVDGPRSSTRSSADRHLHFSHFFVFSRTLRRVGS